MCITGLSDVRQVLILELRQLCQSRQQDDGPSFGSRQQNEFLSHDETQADPGPIQLHTLMVLYSAFP